jgi:uncharacterized repeat protein (TIGR01451 family)
VYDAKALEQATLYGLPMYRINGTSTLPAPPPQGTVTTGGSTGHIVGFNSAPSRVETSHGTIWTGPNGQTADVVDHAIQPLYQVDVTQPGTTVHGLFLTSLSSVDVGGISPALGVPTIDLTAHEPQPNIADETFPASFIHLTRSVALGQDTQRAVLIAGQYRGQGLERLVTGAQAEITMSTSANTTPPIITELGAGPASGGVLIAMTVQQTVSPIARASALYLDGGTWKYTTLSHVSGTNVWTATVSTSGSEIDILGEAQDTDGNVASTTNKGALFRSSATPIAPPAVTLDQPADGAVYTAGQTVNARYACSSQAAISSCAAPVANGAAIDTSHAGSHAFTVTATDIAGQTTSVTHTYMVGAQAALSVSASASPATVSAGQPVTYTALVSNAGPSASSAAKLTATLPSGTTSITSSPSQGTCSTSGVTVTCALGQLGSHASASVTVTGTPTSGGAQTTTFTVSGPETNPNTANAQTTATVTVHKVSNGPIAFTSARDGHFEIYTMNADGTGQKRITVTSSSGSSLSPSWSPDRRTIVFMRAPNSSSSFELWTVRSDGTGATQLTHDTANDSFPSWSPDGVHIAFSKVINNKYAIVVMRADGSNETVLTTEGANDIYPRWSPDGARLAFTSDRSGSLQPYIMNANGSGQAQVTMGGGNVTGAAEWSPDGTHLAVTSNRTGGQNNYQVYTIAVDGTGLKQLTSTGVNVLPAWSPDGALLIFATNRYGTTADLATINAADGSNVKRLTTSPSDSLAAWRAA